MKFYVLTRTCNRPKYFFLNHESIKQQNYENVTQLVSMDDLKTMEYLRMYSNSVSIVNVEKKQRNNANEFPYNSYLTTMVESITEDGWIIVLDDDDKFMKQNFFSYMEQMINEHDEDTMFLWRVKIGNRVVPSDVGFKKKFIRLGDISNIGFMVHSKHKNDLIWPPIRGGDFRIIESLTNILKTVWINEVFTCTNNNTGNFGNQRDGVLNRRELILYEEFVDNYKNKVEKLVTPIKEDIIALTESILNEKEPVYSSSAIDSNVASAIDSNVASAASAASAASTVALPEKEINSFIIHELVSLLKSNEKIYIINETNMQKLLNNQKITTTSIKETNNVRTNAFDVLKKIEQDEKNKKELIMKNEIINNDDIEKYYIVYYNKNLNNLKSYYSKYGIELDKMEFIKSENFSLNSKALIEISNSCIQNDYKKIFILHENCLINKNFKNEINILSNTNNYNNSDLILVGNTNNYGLSKPNTRISSRGSYRNKNNHSSINMRNVDTEFYKNIYEDVQKSFNNKKNIEEHWKSYGISEGRFGFRDITELSKNSSIVNYNGLIIKQKLCQNISECFDESIISIMLQKENFIIRECSPYLFETIETLEKRKYNKDLYYLQ